MSRRWPLLLGILAASAVLGYLLRDVVYQLVIVPIAYVFWLLYFYYSLLPQGLIWAVVLAVLLIAVLWNLLPELPRGSPRKGRRPQPEGDVEALVAWIMKSRRGNYFKWQLANRMGRIARRLAEVSGGRLPPANAAVEKYLDAGMNHSFVDFPTPHGLFAQATETPLDIDPKSVADYLDSLMEERSGRRG